jgi:outer membrane protein OmpA-like peptidoglycan-associated protein
MRIQKRLLASMLCCIAPLSVRAQVSVDPRALDQLRPPAVEAQPARPRPTQARPARPGAPAAAAPAELYGPPRPTVTPAVVPAAPPPGPVIPPPIQVPTRPVPPPPPTQVVADAPGTAIEAQDGLRITFGPGRADLNAVTDAALRTLVHSLPPFNTTLFTLTATAAAEPEDPSTPRRLALSRALAVRGVLIAEGVTSPRIVVKVIGAVEGASGDPMPDRVDIATTVAREPAKPGAGTPKP